jgi:hypothetical protein
MSENNDLSEIGLGKIITYAFGALVLLISISWLIMGNEFFMYKYFAPKTEAVRREVFEQTKSYNQGMVQELQNMQFQYVKADESHKAALADIILHRAADFNFDDPRVPSDLRSFIATLKRERMSAR